MRLSVVRIGNSRGIRIPKNILEQLHIRDSVEMDVYNQELRIKPVKEEVRRGWSDAFRGMHANGDDLPVDGVDLLSEDVDDPDWEW